MTRLDRWIEAHARHTPDTEAIQFESRTWTYADLAEQIARCASTLHRLGVGTGDRVVWLGQNHHELITLLFACARLGAIVAPLNWRLSQHEMQFVLDDATPSLLVADGTLGERADGLATANPALPRHDVEQNGWDTDAVELPAL
ncbi:MAG: AMP-binding protein, partial [Pseudomonadota bacterium]